LDAVMKQRCNRKCSECSEPHPTWASILILPPLEGEGDDDEAMKKPKMMGVLCCFRCQNLFFQLGKDVCLVKSPKMAADCKCYVMSCHVRTYNYLHRDLSHFIPFHVLVLAGTEEEVKALEESGNHAVNSIYQWKLGKNGGMSEIELEQVQVCQELFLRQFVQDKYLERLYFGDKAYRHYLGKKRGQEGGGEGPSATSSSPTTSPSDKNTNANTRLQRRSMLTKSRSAVDVYGRDDHREAKTTTKSGRLRTNSLESETPPPTERRQRRGMGLERSSSHRVPRKMPSKRDIDNNDSNSSTLDHIGTPGSDHGNGRVRRHISDHVVSSRPPHHPSRGGLARASSSRREMMVERRTEGLKRAGSSRRIIMDDNNDNTKQLPSSSLSSHDSNSNHSSSNNNNTNNNKPNNEMVSRPNLERAISEKARCRRQSVSVVAAAILA